MPSSRSAEGSGSAARESGPARDDGELASAALAGERRAFDALVERYQSRIYNLALRVTGNSADALDAAQATFLKVYLNLHRFDARRSFFSWIYRIGMNESLDLVQERRRFTELDPEWANGEPSPEQESAGREAGREVHEAILALPRELRAVIVLRHFHELSYEQMGEVIGVPVKTIKSRLFEARSKLRQRLLRQGPAS
jgi:RNA polymerase sigma-70 factor (ECF subfamily)